MAEPGPSPALTRGEAIILTVLEFVGLARNGTLLGRNRGKNTNMFRPEAGRSFAQQVVQVGYKSETTSIVLMPESPDWSTPVGWLAGLEASLSLLPEANVRISGE